MIEWSGGVCVCVWDMYIYVYIYILYTHIHIKTKTPHYPHHQSCYVLWHTPTQKKRASWVAHTHTNPNPHIIRAQKSSLKASNVCADLVHWLSVPSMMRGSAKGLNPNVYLHHYGGGGGVSSSSRLVVVVVVVVVDWSF